MKRSFSKEILSTLYIDKKLSVSEISQQLFCSENKINYWLKYFEIPKRTISEAIYIKNNPTGDPFIFNKPTSQELYFLYGLGLGLYWGEGNKRNKTSIKLGNTDPKLVKKFIEFLEKIFSIPRSELRFGIQLFSDLSPSVVKDFWVKNLEVNPTQFMKTTVTKTRNQGTYTRKVEYGVITIYFHNKKARDILCSAIEKL